MFETFKENVKELKEDIKESVKKLKDDTVEFVCEYPHVILGAGVTLLYVFGKGVEAANKSNMEVYKNGTDRTYFDKFNHNVDYREWMKYLEALYGKDTKKQMRTNKGRRKWLKENGYID
jgi:hypothetical protein